MTHPTTAYMSRRTYGGISGTARSSSLTSSAAALADDLGLAALVLDVLERRHGRDAVPLRELLALVDVDLGDHDVGVRLGDAAEDGGDKLAWPAPDGVEVEEGELARREAREEGVEGCCVWDVCGGRHRDC
jgi:hypothetical protein